MPPAAPETPLVVLVEDEAHLAQGLLFNLRAEGYRTVHYADGDEALAQLLESTADAESGPSAIVLDCMLPGTDGFTIARTLREHQCYTPILMLTARSQPEDVLHGIEAGADDYLAKPFELSILLVRLKSLLRRMAWHGGPAASPSAPADEYSFCGRTIRFDTLELLVSGRRTQLTLMEAELLRYLTEREGKVVSRKEILEQVWRLHEQTDTRAVDNFIVRLRRYIEQDPAKPKHLQTVRSVGYRFLANP